MTADSAHTNASVILLSEDLNQNLALVSRTLWVGVSQRASTGVGGRLEGVFLQREGIFADYSYAHDSPARVFNFLGFSICHAECLVSVISMIIKSSEIQVPFGSEKQKTDFQRNVSRKKCKLIDCLICLTILREV